ncbi:hypothetical protein ACFV7R_45990 [Streptomyces sp. NPDC059866]|uniref:hypothetical protein n=1 Tax=Streptomyces sp. NPDC059866 TaxID=3346978 RepID=UPI00364B4DB5
MHAKTSRTGLPPRPPPTCALALESVAHHLLKLELANAARDAGTHAELETRGPDGTWRADVLASGPAGVWKTALEVSSLTFHGPVDVDSKGKNIQVITFTGITVSVSGERP